MAKNRKIEVQGKAIAVIQQNNEDYISLTDMAGYKDKMEARIVVSNWMSTYYTVDFLAVWEQVNNPNFNRMGFHTVRYGEGRLLLTPKRWVEMTNAVGIFSKSGRYGGVFLRIKTLLLNLARGYLPNLSISLFENFNA